MRKLHKYISDSLLKNLKFKSTDKDVLKNTQLFMDAKTREATNINMKQIASSLLNLHASIIKPEDGKEIVMK